MSPAKPKRDVSQIDVRGHESELGNGPGGGPLEGGLYLARGLTFDIDDPDLPWLVTLSISAHEGRLVCNKLTVTQRPSGLPVTGAALRSVTVDTYVRLIRNYLAEPSILGGVVLTREVGRGDGAVYFESPDEEALLAFDSAQRRRLSKAELLPLVADAYRAALSSPLDCRAPTLAVARRLHFSRGHTARLVAESRKAGHLGPARRGTSGELPGAAIEDQRP